jgi:hypothetical protein
MHTSCYSPTRQASYASTQFNESPVAAESVQAEGFKSSKTPKSPFQNSSKISKSYKRPRKTHLKFLGPLSSHTTLAAHQAAIVASPLLSLPGELRNMIYAYALTAETKLLTYDDRDGRFDVSGIGAGLLQTCHVVSRETMYLPLLLNTLAFGSSTGSGENEERMLKCLGKVINLGWKIELKDGVDIEVLSQKEMEFLYSKRPSEHAQSLLVT